MSKTKFSASINVIQAVRSMLYIPVYLSAERLKVQDITLNICNPHDGNGNEIVGDAEAFNEFMRSDKLHFCICDPMMVLLNDPDLNSNAVIVGTLIRKVALWAMSKNDTINNRVIAGGRKANYFKSPWIVGKNVVSYSSPSTAGTIAAHYSRNASLTQGGNFRIFDTENGLELQYLDKQLNGKMMDIVITADLLAYEAHYNYNKNAREVQSFADNWEEFFFTGIITKRELLESEYRIYIEKFLSAIKKATSELYNYTKLNNAPPVGFIDELVKDLDKYTRFQLHEQFNNINYDKKMIVDRALKLYLNKNIASKSIVVDFKSFDTAFELRNTIEKLPKSSKLYYKKLVDNRIAKLVDKKDRKPYLHKIIEFVYENIIITHKKFWSITIPSVAAIIFNVLSDSTAITIIISVVFIVILAFIIEKILIWIEKDIYPKYRLIEDSKEMDKDGNC